MIDQQFFTQQELEELFGKLEATPDARIFLKHNVNGEYAQGQQFFVTAVHFDSKQKRSYYAVNIEQVENVDRETEQTDQEYSDRLKAVKNAKAEESFKKIQEACQLVEDTGQWPVPF